VEGRAATETILVIDDQKQVRDLLQEVLEQEGYRVIVAYDGAEGVTRVAQDNPDLVLLDVLMPKQDGWATLEKIRRISQVPVIMLTVQGGVANKVRGLERGGADDYLVKPFGIEELIARIHAVRRRRHK
jgi:DNA-binding response OmpR family regulator